MKLTLQQLKDLGYVEHNGEWKKRSAVGGLLPAQPKQDPLPALDHQPKERRRRTQRVAVRITFIRVGKALLDDDNLASCFKGSRDAVAKALGIDDRDPPSQMALRPSDDARKGWAHRQH